MSDILFLTGMSFMAATIVIRWAGKISENTANGLLFISYLFLMGEFVIRDDMTWALFNAVLGTWCFRTWWEGSGKEVLLRKIRRAPRAH